MWIPEERQYVDVERFSVVSGSRPMLTDITLHIPRGAFVSVIGRSGSGKTTLLRALNGQIGFFDGCRHTGDIRFGDLSIFDGSVGEERVRRRATMAFDRPYLFPMSVLENIVYPLRLDGLRRKSLLREHAYRILDAFGVGKEIGTVLDRFPHELPLSIAQMVSFFRAVIREPDLLMLDDTCARLDPLAARRLEELIRKAADATTVVMSTNDIEQAKRLSDFVVVLDGGQLVDLVTLAGGDVRVLSRPLRR